MKASEVQRAGVAFALSAVVTALMLGAGCGGAREDASSFYAMEKRGRGRDIDIVMSDSPVEKLARLILFQAQRDEAQEVRVAASSVVGPAISYKVGDVV
jgi:hypothetical protein